MVRELKSKNIKYHVKTFGSIIISLIFALALFAAVSSCAGVTREELIQQAKKAIEAADPFMGDWQGNWKLDDETESGSIVAQVIALGKGKYQVNLLEEFDKRIEPIVALEGQCENDAVHLAGPGKYDGWALQIKAAIEAGKFTGSFEGRNEEGQETAGTFSLEKVYRLSPTLGAKPPAEAIVLFDGKNFDQWTPAGKKSDSDKAQWILVDGAMEVKPGAGSIITKKQFKDIKLHLEFCTPFMPEARGQGRGNSGVYLQGRYEVQVLDSYGLEGKSNECGGIYGVADPLVNMCAPPVQWQTFGIIFRAPHFDSAGQKAKKARLTIFHNGVKIHENVEVGKATTAAPDASEAQAGGIYLQDHGNKLQYRNIWVVELPPDAATQ